MSRGKFLAAALLALLAGPCWAQRVASLPALRAPIRLAAPARRPAPTARLSAPRALPSAPRPAPAFPRSRLPGPSVPEADKERPAGPAAVGETLDRMSSDVQEALEQAGVLDRAPADQAKDAGGRIEDIVTGASRGGSEPFVEPDGEGDALFLARPAGEEIRQAAEAQFAAGDGWIEHEPRRPAAPGRAAAVLERAGLEPETPWLSNLPWVSAAAAVAGAGIYLGLAAPGWVPGAILLAGGIALGGMVLIMGYGLFVALLSAFLRVEPPQLLRLGKAMVALFYAGVALSLAGGSGVMAAMIAALISRLS